MTSGSNKSGMLAFAAAAALALGSAPAWARASQAASTPSPVAATRASEPVRAFLRVDLRAGGPAPRELYVGQTVPVTIRAYFLRGTGVSLTGNPHLTSDGLTLSELPEKPVQSSAVVGGFPYTVLTWTGRLTAARAGGAQTDVELPVEVSYVEPPRGFAGPGAAPDPGGDDDGGGDAESDDDDPFSSVFKNSPLAKDPFFSRMFKGGDPFAGMMRDLEGTIRQRAVTLHSPGATVDVRDLPSPQPAGFTGAVGSFEISAAVSNGPYHVGEPISLRMNVRGDGSFPRLSLAGVPSTPALTSYGTTIAAGQAAPGEKWFTQTLVPRQVGATTIPSVALTYFDPRARRYVTRRTAPTRIDVAPAAGEAAPPPEHLSGAATTSGAGAAAPAGSPARAQVPDATSSTLTPLIRTRRFPFLVGALALATALLMTFGRLARRGSLARWRAARRLKHELAVQRRALRDAASRGDAAALFGAGRRALQARLGAAWGQPPDAIASADVTRHLGPRGDGIRDIFERADRYSYAGPQAAAPGDLEQWPERIAAELHSLESST